ncbi:MucR family transcriptional regulator [Methylobacterium sp. WL9]|uniref:MucR family transcriptional regulator n=1 Tax=Methylobacterium sp. WL9 TaxID=2603898 RepID=UPI0011CC2327|nr:MucR family transcriptional regulator [Methylobacterium sp. WL9]TXN23993.1 MucR family transcriptional regulator [Methylobacterium sp. WL9]
MSEVHRLQPQAHRDDGTSFNPLVALTVDIVSAYVSHNAVSQRDLPALIRDTHAAIVGLGRPVVEADQAAAEIEKPTPAQIRKSITPDALISFVDGKPYKSMKRHLGTHGLDPHTYRQRYGLPSDYPMVAPSYSAARSALAKAAGLGVPGGRAPAPDTASNSLAA